MRKSNVILFHLASPIMDELFMAEAPKIKGYTGDLWIFGKIMDPP